MLLPATGMLLLSFGPPSAERVDVVARRSPTRPAARRSVRAVPWRARVRYDWAALFLVGGLGTLACLALFPDVRVGVVIGVVATLAGIGLFQWAGTAR